MKRHIEADPYRWPYDGDLRSENTVVIVIDMQTDFCGEGGYVDKMGYDLSLTRAPIEPIRKVAVSYLAIALVFACCAKFATITEKPAAPAHELHEPGVEEVTA